MADRTSLAGLGYVFAVVTVIVNVIAGTLVFSHASSQGEGVAATPAPAVYAAR